MDLVRNQMIGWIPLPEVAKTSPGAIVLNPEGTTLAILTPSGVAIVAVSSAWGSTPCRGETSTPVLAGLCGPLAEIVIDRTGHAFASNPDRNRIEVVTLATGAVEAPIAVGSRPTGLDLSADGTMLYVANSGAEEISVIDIAFRREVPRISPCPRPGTDDRPNAIAVGDHGKALFATTAGAGSRARGELDLASGWTGFAPTTPGQGGTGTQTILRATADRVTHRGWQRTTQAAA